MPIYNDFAEIEEDVKKKVPPILYKYRDWRNEKHQQILTENKIWLTHPKKLNDPYDIRVPVRFDYSEIDHPLFYEKLKLLAQERLIHLNPDSREFRIICENQFDIIKADPKKYFEKNYLDLRESDIYDIMGIFSLTKDPLDETMWAHYGADSTGFCVGFDTIGLARELNINFGIVNYDKEPPPFSFIKSFQENEKDTNFLKHTKWSNEQEFRFLTFAIKLFDDRLVAIKPNLIKEIIVGDKIPKDYLNEIINLLSSKYESKVNLYKIKATVGKYGLDKDQINYV